MGGHGSGRRAYALKPRSFVEDHYWIDVLRWHRMELLRQQDPFTWTWRDEDGRPTASIGVAPRETDIILLFSVTRQDGRCEKVRRVLPVEWTPCPFGGTRPWFRCPQCGQRKTKLCLKRDSFLCRHCLNLAYKTQYEDLYSRMIRKQRKNRLRVGGHPNLLKYFPDKPKGMHWRTFARFKEKDEAVSNRVLQCILNWIKKAEV